MNSQNIDHPNYRTAVTNLQTYLRQLSYTEPSIPAPPIDGVFGDITQDALIAFQAQNGLRVTGVADEETWNLLYEEYLLSIQRYSPPKKISAFPRQPNGYELDIGTQSFAVLSLQYMLGEIVQLYDEVSSVEMTGRYDQATANSVKAFQKKNLLPETGRVDKMTWDYIVDSYEITFNDYIQ